MEPVRIIAKYYNPESLAYRLLIHHSRMVAEKAVMIAGRVKHLGPHLDFIREAAMVHDIGIFMTNEPKLGCYGDKKYICHGYLGREIIEKEGFPEHALVCERHVGVGLTLQEIEEKNLPVPRRDMVPVTVEEQIICFADKFFSKDDEFLLKEKTIERIREGIAKYGEEKLRQFDQWLMMFGY